VVPVEVPLFGHAGAAAGVLVADGVEVAAVVVVAVLDAVVFELPAA
jgi:hypothetical protein